MKIKLDPYLVKRKVCPFKETYKEKQRNLFTNEIQTKNIVIKVGPIACSKCRYFDMANFKQKEKPKYIVCNNKTI